MSIKIEFSNDLKVDEIKSVYSSLVSKIGGFNKTFSSEELNFFNVSFNEQYVKNIQDAINSKKRLNSELIVVVGIGGSDLGAKAIYESLKSVIACKEVLFLDSLDGRDLEEAKEKIKNIIYENGNIIINVISKSGETLETIANSEILIELMNGYGRKYSDYLVVTSNKDSKLHRFAMDKGCLFLEIPKNIGGRFSVFSAAGLFPLGLAGINVDELIRGAKDFTSNGMNKEMAKNISVNSAIVQYLNYKKGMNITDYFMFDKSLESLGKWVRQLISESLGKENEKGRKIGITPTVSIGSVDLHSMAQLYFAGPKDKSINFINIKNRNNSQVMPKHSNLGILNYIQGKNIYEINNSIFLSVLKEAKKRKISFVNISFDGLSEYNLAQFMQWKMIETVILAELLKVDAFNQPAVEGYKSNIRKILGK